MREEDNFQGPLVKEKPIDRPDVRRVEGWRDEAIRVEGGKGV
jgi:hypothetical protein